MKPASILTPGKQVPKLISTVVKSRQATVLMDRFHIALGYSRQELEAVEYRGWLYLGMIYMTGLASAFVIMASIG